MKIDPRLKLVIAATLTLAVLVTHNQYFIGILFLPIAAMAALARVRLCLLLKMLLAISPFLLMNIVLGMSPDLSDEVLSQTVLFVRIALMALIALTLNATTSQKDLMGALLWFLSPLRHLGVDPDRLGTILGIGILYAPVISEEVTKSLKSSFGRGRLSIQSLPSEASALLYHMIRKSMEKSDEIEAGPNK